jgi:hypothetical protein
MKPRRRRRRIRLRRSVLVALAIVIVPLAVGSGARSSLCLDRTSFASPNNYDFGLIGQSYDDTRLQEERDAGIETKVFELSWREYYPSEGEKDSHYVQVKRAQMEELRKAGFKIILSFGYHDTPTWVHHNYQDSYYVNQFGERWTGDTFDVGDRVVVDAAVARGTPTDNGDANLVFNYQVRGMVASYMKDVFRDFGTDFYGVRLGGGRYGEMSYPPDSFGGKDNLYWAYDENAQKSAKEAGIGGWRPGDSSPDGEAARFLYWYLDSLVDYQNWQVDTVREAGYSGRLMILYPGPGIRPGQIEEATASNLDGFTPAEANGEIQSGRDFARQVGAIEDENVLVTTTALEVDPSEDDGRDPSNWTAVKYLSSLAESNPVHPGLYGENSGSGSLEDMQISASQMQRYGLIGMAWYDEEQLFSGRYATLDDYGCVIKSCHQSER